MHVSLRLVQLSFGYDYVSMANVEKQLGMDPSFWEQVHAGAPLALTRPIWTQLDVHSSFGNQVLL